MQDRSPATRQRTWKEMDLVRRLCHALAIAEKAVEGLASQGYIDVDEPDNSIRPEKLISEAALLLLAASTAARHDEVGTRIHRVAQLLIPHARSERMLFGMCRETARAFDYAQAHICLTRLGYHDANVDALLQQSDRAQARSGHERVPHRMLEQAWLRATWKSTISNSRAHISRIALNSLLHQPMDVFGGREDIYAFTHALMYVTDFNICPQRLPRRRAVILAEAEAALAGCLDEQDYDLAGEVLLAWPLTGKSWNPAAAFGFRVLAHVEDKAGFLPAPTTRLERLHNLQGGERVNYLLATAYHTAFVMGLVCAAALQPGKMPPATIPVRAVRDGSATAILQFLDAGALNRHWRDELDQLSNRERDAMAGLLFCIALRRNINQRDFGSVAQLLKIGYTLGLANTPAASQSAEMLERLATCTQILRTREMVERHGSKAGSL